VAAPGSERFASRTIRIEARPVFLSWRGRDEPCGRPPRCAARPRSGEALTAGRSLAGIAALLVGAVCFALPLRASGTAPFVFDGNRVYVELSFVRPDGRIHRALAFVDMGSPSMEITAALFKELALDQSRPLSFRIGDLLVNIPRSRTRWAPTRSWRPCCQPVSWRNTRSSWTTRTARSPLPRPERSGPKALRCHFA